MERLGILYYVSSFPKLSQSFILNEISELYNRGHNIAVFAHNDPEENITHEEYEDIDVPIYYMNASYADFPQLLSKKSAQMALNHVADGFFNHFSAKQTGHNLLSGKQCAEYIESLNFDVDVITAHFATPTRIAATLAAQYHNIPCTVTAHAFEIFASPNIPQIKYICDSMNHVIVPSKYNRDYLCEEIGINNDITVVPATTKIEKFESSAPTVNNRVLTVARLVEKKGYRYAIEAIRDLIERGYNIGYHIIGTGGMKSYLYDQVNRYNIEDQVNFLGHVSDKRLQRELSEASVFVLPCAIAEDGDRDAMPVALKEAMASETACISTTVSAVPELITDGHDGLLVPEKDSDRLASAIQALLDNPDKRESLAKKGYMTVSNTFDISESVDTLIEIFESIR